MVVTDYQRERQLRSIFFSLGNSSNFGTKANAEDREKQADRIQRRVTESTTSMPQFSRTKSIVTAFPNFPSQERMASLTQKLVVPSPVSIARGSLDITSLKTSLVNTI